VTVDATTRTVTFRYVPGFTYLGFVVAAASLALAVGWAWSIRRRDRRRHVVEVVTG
jgi:hypothetical protein